MSSPTPLRALLAALAFVPLLTACPDSDPAEDSGTPADSGPRADASVTPDAGAPRPDAAGIEDTGPGAEDAMPRPDSGQPVEDAGVTPDAEVGPDVNPAGEVIIRRAPGAEWVPLLAVFHDPAGEVISSHTSTAPELRETVLPGSMLTVLPLFIGTSGKSKVAAQLVTITGIEPGDVYLYEPFGPPQMEVGEVELTLPGEAAGAVDYTYDFGCGEYFAIDPTMTEPAQVVLDSCLDPATSELTVLALARDEAGIPVAFSFLEHVVLSGTTTPLVLGPWRTDFASVDVTVDNPPPEAFEVSLYQSALAGGHQYGFTEGYLDLTAGPGTSELDLPPLGASYLESFFLVGNDSEALHLSLEAQFGPRVIDLGTDLLPFVEDLEVVPTAGSPDRPELTWSPPGAGDALYIQLRHEGGGQEVVWAFITEPGAGRLKLPALPDEHALFRPIEESMFSSATALGDINHVTTYTQYRRTAATRVGDLTFTRQRELVPGTIARFSLFQYIRDP